MSDEHIETEGILPIAATERAEPEGYDTWFRREVEIGLREANEPNAVFYTLEEVEERMRLRRAQRVTGPDEPTNYDEWLKRELAIGIAEADDPNAVSYSVEEVSEYMRQQKAAYLRQPLERAS